MGNPTPTIPPVEKGYKRTWKRCRTCGGVYFYDYVPYSLSNPIRVTPCGHGYDQRDLGCDTITADEALIALLARKPEAQDTETA